MDYTAGKIFELVVALAAGGVITTVVRAFINRDKDDAEAKKLVAERDTKIVDIAIKMTHKLESSLKDLETKTEGLVKKNLELETELLKIKLSNENLSREVDALKTHNKNLQDTCDVLIRENVNLKVSLENCINAKEL